MSNACIDVSAFVKSECVKNKVVDIAALTRKAVEVAPKYALDDVREHVVEELKRLEASYGAAAPKNRKYG